MVLKLNESKNSVVDVVFLDINYAETDDPDEAAWIICKTDDAAKRVAEDDQFSPFTSKGAGVYMYNKTKYEHILSVTDAVEMSNAFLRNLE